MSFANNAATTLASSITNVATSLTVQTGAGALFPTLTGSQYFYCTLENGSGTSREIIKVTARSTDTFTIVRGQDGTTGTAFSINDKVELRLVRANLQDFALLDEANTFSQQQTVSSGIKFGDGTTQTTAPIASSYSGVTGQAFTANGTFTIPTGVTSVKVTVVGGGGGGASSSGAQLGGTGGTSSVASGTQTITTIQATGGGGGDYVNGTVGSGGTSSGGTLNTSGITGTTTQGAVVNGAPSILGMGYGSGGSSYGSFQGGGSGGAAIKYLTALTPGNTLGVTIGSGGAAAYSLNSTAGATGVVIFEW